MDKSRAKKIAVKVVITFVEAAIAYWVTTGQLATKAALAGAIGAGISAVYNLSRHYLGA